MTDDEIRRFLLERPRTATLATVRADGRPHATPAWFDLDGAIITSAKPNTSSTSGLGRRPTRAGRLAAMRARPHVERLLWDGWNREHIAKHAVVPEEVDEVIAAEPVVRDTYKERLQLIGPTQAGRMLAVIVGPVPAQPGVYYVFSPRPASRRERRFCDQQQGGSTR